MMLITDISPMLWKLFLRSSVAWLIQLVTFYGSKQMLFFNLNTTTPNFIELSSANPINYLNFCLFHKL